jgi:hypothetical protein
MITTPIDISEVIAEIEARDNVQIERPDVSDLILQWKERFGDPSDPVIMLKYAEIAARWRNQHVGNT